MNRFSLAAMCVSLASFGAHSQLANNQLYGNECNEGFIQLFNGQTRANFNTHWVDYVQYDGYNTGLASGWSYDGTTQAVVKTGAPNDIRSVRQFADFDWRVQYKSNGNAGLFYRSTLDYGNIHSSGMEFNLENNLNIGNPKDAAGGACDLYEPNPSSAYNPYSDVAGAGWNEARIVVIGDSAEHWLNGVRVVKFRYFSPDYNDRYAISKWASARQMGYAVAGSSTYGAILRGYIGMQGSQQGNLFVRNIRIDTTPSWTAAYQWPPNPNSVCAAASPVSPAGKVSGSVQTTFSGHKLKLSSNGEPLEEAVLLDASGRELMSARINPAGAAEFNRALDPGVYYVRYKSGGSIHSLRVGWVQSN